MMARMICFILVMLVFNSASMAQRADLELKITGHGENENGEHFAIVKGVGLVEKGDSIIVGEEKLRCVVVDINADGMTLKRLGKVAQREAKPQKRKYELRDPFWPVGYEPEE